MSNEELVKYALSFIIALLVYFYTAKSFFNKKTEEKRISWLISLINSLVMTILGVVYLAAKVPVLEGLFLYNSHASEIFHSPTSNFTALTCLWFGIANVLDLILGFIYYKKYLDTLTAFVHHSVFIWIMVTCTTGNGIFIQVSSIFIYAYIYTHISVCG